MTEQQTAPSRGSRRLRTFAHALGNIFLGIALGLAGYYLATGIQSRLSQAELLNALGARVDVAAATPDTPAMDWEGWEEQDVAYWEALPQGGAFARIVADSIDLDAVVVKGHSRADLRKGPGWLDYTSLPGPTGNTGIAGHRTTYGAPFGQLHRLAPGDTIDLYSPYRRYRYTVTGSEQVTPDKVEVMADTASPQLTLSACDPPYSARYRLIVHADLVEVRRLETNE